MSNLPGDPPPKPMKVFIAWDSDLNVVRATFASLQKHPPIGVTLAILGEAGSLPIGDLQTRIADGLADAKGMLAVVDTPNANMAWELGIALAKGLRIALATEGKAPVDDWVRGTPLEQLLRAGLVGDGEVAEALVQAHARWPAPPTPPSRGHRKLLLCPSDGTGVLWRRALSDTLGKDGWELLDTRGWKLADLPALLHDVDRLAWVMLPVRRDDHRHGVANTIGALVAGYVDALGIPVRALWCKGGPTVLDAAHCRSDFDGAEDGLIAAIRVWSEALNAPVLPRVSPLAAYRARVHALHANPLRYVTRLGLVATDLVPVALDVEAGGPMDRLGGPAGSRAEGCRSGRLHDLVNEDLRDHKPARWLVKADPGAGKTTLMRQLAYDLSAEDATTAPVFVSLSEWEEHDGTIVEAALRQSRGRDTVDVAGDRLVIEALARLGKVPGGVWLFLDGFDEVQKHDAMRDRIQKLARDPAWAGAVIVVTSRAGAVERGRAWDGFTAASLRYLTDAQQAQLIGRLLGGKANQILAFHRDMGERPGVAMLLRNPFLLTLAVGLHARAGERDEVVPVDRVALLVRALDDCLDRGWAVREGEERSRRWSARGARHVLRALSLELHRKGGESWSREVVADVLNDLGGHYRKVRAVYGRDGMIWRSDTEFLDDVQHYAGVLGPLDGEGLPWRYLHRSLHEMLAAEALADEMSAAERGKVIGELLSAKTKETKAANDGPGRSGEVIALLAARLLDANRDGQHHDLDPAEPVRHLERLVKAAPDAAVRVLASVERLDAWEHLLLLLSVPAPEGQPWRQVGWDNDQLDAVLDAIARGHGADSLWAALTPGMSIFHLGVLWYALERVETWGADSPRWSPARREAAAQRFFSACGLSDRKRPEISAVSVPGGTFWMGSPPGLGRDEERPRHRVTVASFVLGRLPVTVGQYRALDETTEGAEAHPVTNVDWFSARLFAAWVGGRLPTEAEWEHACRAGSDTAWPFGDDVKALGNYAWFDDDRTHPVGEKRPNALGLQDMLGSVWEWCEDRFGSYSAAPEDNPSGPPRGFARVLRGGSSWWGAAGCRSAFRFKYLPDDLDRTFGFRVVLGPRAPNGTLVVDPLS